jgi:short-subunit dehydrogenase
VPRIDLRGKPIVITGASSGIGAATAIACAAAGMPVVLGARRVDKLEAVAARIRGAGGRVVVQACDVVHREDCAALVETCVREFGSIHAVYANAGYGIERSVIDTTDDEYRAIFETNFFGSLNVIRPAVAHMRKAGAGHVLLCSSCLAKVSVPFYAAYSATKSAQAHIGRAMRLEMAGTGIEVSIVCPIGTRTEFFDTVQAKGGTDDSLVQHTPEGFKQSPDFVAALTVRCLRRPIPEVWTGFKGRFVRFGMSVMTLWPWLADMSLRGMVARRQK